MIRLRLGRGGGESGAAASAAGVAGGVRAAGASLGFDDAAEGADEGMGGSALLPVNDKQRERLAKLDAWRAKKRARVEEPDGPSAASANVASAAAAAAAPPALPAPSSAPDADPLEAFFDSLGARASGEPAASAESRTAISAEDLETLGQGAGAAQAGGPRKRARDDDEEAGEKRKGEEEEDDDDPAAQAAFLAEFRRRLAEEEAGGGGGEAGARGRRGRGTGRGAREEEKREDREDGDGDGAEEEDEEEEATDRARDGEEGGRGRAASGMSALEALRARVVKKVIPQVDHSLVEYEEFQRVFYQEPVSVQNETAEEVERVRRELRIHVRGKQCPRPIATWEQCGLTESILAVLVRQGYAQPTAVQRQAVPAIMAGRDTILIARTGSGKTLAYLLPLLRHVAARRPPVAGSVHTQGPLALVLAPARELAIQIFAETERFARDLGIRVAAVFGGMSTAEQVAALRRGVHIAVATPGRLVDAMSIGGGRGLALERVTMIVVDEADRMFDLGFGPQVQRVLQNVRPDRQMVLCSATFPAVVEDAAMAALQRPVEIVVGARNAASPDVDQHVELRGADSKFRRLLQLLGEWQERGKVLVFVDSKLAAEALFSQLLSAGYPALCLHGGKEEDEREATIDDFKSGFQPLLVATGLAGRGLDVKDLKLVVNYDCPPHLEEYIHRVGRTGRAGAKGTAYTFITPDEAELAPDMVHALRSTGQPIPPDLDALAKDHLDKVKRKEARPRRSGYSARGRSILSDTLDEARLEREISKRKWELEQGLTPDDETSEQALADLRAELESLRARKLPRLAAAGAGAGAAEAAASAATTVEDAVRVLEEQVRAAELDVEAARARAAATEAAAKSGVALQKDVLAAHAAWQETSGQLILLRHNLEQARARAAAATAAGADPATLRLADAASAHISAEQVAEARKRAVDALARFVGDVAGPSTTTIPINSYPLQARRRAVGKETVTMIAEMFGVAVTARGVFVPPGKAPPPGQQPLHLNLEGPTAVAVDRAASELRRILDEATDEAGHDATSAASAASTMAADPYGKYTLDIN